MACVRSTWSAFLPATLVFTFCFFSSPISNPFHKLLDYLGNPLQKFLTLREAEALVASLESPSDELGQGYSVPDTEPETTRVHSWRTMVFVFTGITVCLCWVMLSAFRIYLDANDLITGLLPSLVAVAWLYTAIRPITRPTTTPPFDMFAVYSTLHASAIILFGGILYDHLVFGSPLPPQSTLVAHILNLGITFGLLVVILFMPMELPNRCIKKETTLKGESSEDYTFLWRWMTFGWVTPLIRRVCTTTLTESDVWDVSPTMRSRILYMKFSSIRQSTLLRRLWVANSYDVLIDFLLEFAIFSLRYASPFFLKRILAEIERPTEESKANVFIYAVLLFACSIIKAQITAQQLMLGLRISTCISSQLRALIFEKALKRKDYSALPQHEAEDGGAGTSKSGSDTAKIMNLMTTDENRISWMAKNLNTFIMAPFDILICGAFLYSLLGWSAFTGCLAMVIVWPANGYISKWSSKIWKAASTATDNRVGVISELLGAIKMIKFFAWEDHWIRRALEAREMEMKAMIMSSTIDILFNAVGRITPAMVSIISFSAFVLQGNTFTVTIAFTAISLVQMINRPFIVLPTLYNQLLRTYVSFERISNFLEEEEVPEHVSSLKRETLADEQTETVQLRLGLQNATLHWNGEPSDVPVTGLDLTMTESKNAFASSSLENVTTEDVNPAAPCADDNGERRFELRDISVMFPDGKLTIVTGPTASGKTALLLALLGEMTLLKGNLILSKNSRKVDEYGFTQGISYAAQTPWLMHQSIKDNILFGYPYEEDRYNTVVECCALLPDFSILEDGDLTEIGARGVTLSGGQKARVALARAVYARTKYVLLDDPLSAVDSHTARFLYEELLLGPLLENRTIVLVTHHVELVLAGAHYLVRMVDGRIDMQGNVKDLQAQGLLDVVSPDDDDASKRQAVKNTVVMKTGADDLNDKIKSAPRRLVEDEHRESGAVKWSVYKRYVEAFSYWISAMLLILFAMAQILGITQKLWIKIWGEAYRPRMLGEPVDQSIHPTFANFQWPTAIDHPLFYVGVYATIYAITVVIDLAAMSVQFMGSRRASRLLFKQLVNSVVRATFRFHDTTPQGRLLNRFGTDLDNIDYALSSSIHEINVQLVYLFTSVATVIAIFPYFMIPAVFIGIAYHQLVIKYVNAGRDLRRLESTMLSPIYADIAELLEGVVTVRAFSAEPRFFNRMHARADGATKMTFALSTTGYWFQLNCDALGALGVLTATLFSIAMPGSNAGTAGLCITIAMGFTDAVDVVCRRWSNLELDLNAVERVVEYLDLPQEPPTIGNSRPPAYWPTRSGNDALVVVENLSVRYAPDLPDVLHDVSFTLRAGEKVGLIGRTGSGKSTLVMSLMRFVDPANGRIVIDGIDISKIGLYDLRSKLTFIPQDAVLFSGTLRDNINPFGDYTDVECLVALRRAQLIRDTPGARTPNTSNSPAPIDFQTVPTKGSADCAGAPAVPYIGATTVASDEGLYDHASSLSLTLDTQVSAGGTNFSQGQRQLIALARAMLRRSAIVLFDEATSSIDLEMDDKIQKVIREEFEGSLLLTVAHRLRTVIDYDRLIVLDQGHVSEHGTPLALIQTEGGIFRTMCEKSGLFAELEAMVWAKAEVDILKTR